ncbi:MAG TPA: hypothetical protein VFE12_11675, partial [Acetobacteraceae bacterium]|nr:hypothetical protein [Acetobacteraceae bacterium]
SAANTLELAAAATAGTLDGLGSDFLNFGSIVLDGGAAWSIGGTVTTGQILRFAGTGDLLTLNNPRSVSGTIDGFNDHDTIALAGITNVTGASMGTNHLLTITRSVGAPITLRFDPSQDFSADVFEHAVAGSATDITMTVASAVHWVAGNGNFNTAADWEPQGIPGAANNITIDAAGTYTVTASTDETVNSLTVEANATLVVSAGTFTVSNHSVTNALTGSLSVNNGAVLVLAGSVANDGTLTNAGTIIGNGGTALAFVGNGHNLLVVDPGAVFSGAVVGNWSAANTLELAAAATAGTLDGLGSNFRNFGSIVLDAGAAWTIGGAVTTGQIINIHSGAVLALAGSVTNGGLIEATGAGGLTIASGTISNAGAMLAASGSTLTFQPGVVNSNNKGGVLSWGTFKWNGGLVVGGGTWEADGNGSTLSVTGGAVTTDRAAIVLSGAGSVFRAGDGSTFTKLEASLSSVAPIGVLELLAGRSFTATHGIADHGMIQLGGGTLTLPRLAVGAGGHVRGFGTMADTRYPIFNGGTIEANGGTLAIATAIDPASSGVFQLDASSVLEIAADQGAGGKISFLGAGGELIIDAAQKFGLNVGSSAYTGPLVQNFATGDAILLKNVAPAGLTPVYSAATGIVQLSNGSANAASLMFDKTTLGAGSFHIGDDGHGHALLTHS